MDHLLLQQMLVASDVRLADLIGAAPVIVPVSLDGMIDTAALVVSDRCHNLRAADLSRDTALLTIAVKAEAAVDTVHSDAIQKILDGT
jgi:hypothetical protein